MFKSPVTIAQMDELTACLPTVFGEGAEPFVTEPNWEASDVIVLSGPKYSDAVRDLFFIAASEQWQDPDYMSKGAEVMLGKREVKALASAVKAGTRASKARGQEASAVPAAAAPGIRFSAERFAALRAKLGLTQAELATLLGVSYLSVHKWEGGKAQPRAVQLQKIAAVMKMGKREAAKQLQA